MRFRDIRCRGIRRADGIPCNRLLARVADGSHAVIEIRCRACLTTDRVTVGIQQKETTWQR